MMYLDEPAPMTPPEEVVPLHDPKTGMRGAIVLHSTSLGPAAGSCRLARYASDRDAMHDALRLAEGMTMKNALADIPFGGGSVVASLPPEPFDRQTLLGTIGRAVAALEGRCIIFDDLEVRYPDAPQFTDRAPHATDRTETTERLGGDASYWTAFGVLTAMRVAVRHHLGLGLGDVTVAVQGLGRAGLALCDLLHNEGAALIVSDSRSDIVASTAVAYGAQVMSCSAQMRARADVFAPCGIGAILDVASARTLRAKVVCGAAENQLFGDHQALQLARRGILYAPDFLVNAGGAICAAGDQLHWSQEEVAHRVSFIGPRLMEIIDCAERTGVTPMHAARQAAFDRIAHRRRGRAVVV